VQTLVQEYGCTWPAKDRKTNALSHGRVIKGLRHGIIACAVQEKDLGRRLATGGYSTDELEHDSGKCAAVGSGLPASTAKFQAGWVGWGDEGSGKGT
jgi:hypothetical protein